MPQAEDAVERNRKYGGRTGKYNLRKRKPRSYGHLRSLTHSDTSNSEESLAKPQMSMKRGLKEFGTAGVKAVGIEIKQLHDLAAVKPRRPRS